MKNNGSGNDSTFPMEDLKSLAALLIQCDERIEGLVTEVQELRLRLHDSNILKDADEPALRVAVRLRAMGRGASETQRKRLRQRWKI